MEKYHFTTYDPFPVGINEKRQLGDFVFYFDVDKQIKTYRYSRSSYIKTIYKATIHDQKTNETRVSFIQNFSRSENSSAEIDEIEAYKFLKSVRKNYTIKKTIWAFNKTKKFDRRGKIATYNEINPSYFSRRRRNLEDVDFNDDFIKRLKPLLLEDKKQWMKEKKDKKNNNDSKVSDLEDAIRTNELIKILPLLNDLQEELNYFNSKGTEYTKKDAIDLKKKFDLVKNRSRFWSDIKKNGL